MDKDLREFQRMVQGEGLRLLSLKRMRSGHYKAQIQDSTGKTLTYTMAASASDYRAALNRKKDIKRFFNN